MLQPNPLLYPDYREHILRIFQQLLEVNNALGEVYKAKSYHFALQELRRGDHIFRVLPPNLLPLPKEQSNLSEWLQAHMELEPQHPDMIANWERRIHLLDPSTAISGVGDKLKGKIIEILKTGDLQELHAIYKRPEVSAMREICKVHGFGPRTALSLFRKHKIKSVAELKKIAASSGSSSGISFNDGQKLGLQYFDDIQRRIPHAEGKLHEAYLKTRLREHFGTTFSLVICGSFRRRTEYSGDIDILLTPYNASIEGEAASCLTDSDGKGRSGGKKNASAGSRSTTTTSSGAVEDGESSGGGSTNRVLPQGAVRAFVEALREDQYIQATFALGSTKFMGMGRLKGTPPAAIAKAIAAEAAGEVGNDRTGSSSSSSSSNSSKSSASSSLLASGIYPARRIDVRYVDAASFPAASLYFTGSKNFNVVMRARAVKMQLVLNEYGLFKQEFLQAATAAAAAVGGGSNRGSTRMTPLWSINELITRLTRYAFWSRGSALLAQCGAAGFHAASNEDLLLLPQHGANSSGKKGKSGKTSDATSSASADSKDGGGPGVTVLNEAKQKDLLWLVHNLNYLRIPATSEQDIFTALGMAYVDPWERCF